MQQQGQAADLAAPLLRTESAPTEIKDKILYQRNFCDFRNPHPICCLVSREVTFLPFLQIPLSFLPIQEARKSCILNPNEGSHNANMAVHFKIQVNFSKFLL